ncbi:hypothetical protein Hanom_Chr01g00007951 [Helianthus anomalus]
MAQTLIPFIFESNKQNIGLSYLLYSLDPLSDKHISRLLVVIPAAELSAHPTHNPPANHPTPFLFDLHDGRPPPHGGGTMTQQERERERETRRRWSGEDF